MKRSVFFFCLSAYSILFLFLNPSKAQINVQMGPEVTPEDMVVNLLGEDVIFDNVTFQGADFSRGIFTNNDTINLEFAGGIFLTSGGGYNIPGPNNSSEATANNGLPGHALLESISTGPTYDAAVLGFDFIAEFDTLKIKFVFGSEEYNEWVGASFNDVCGIFLSGPDPTGGYFMDKNLAIIPESSNTSICVNNVNNGYAPPFAVPSGPCINCEYFLDNSGGVLLQYDGLTAVLTAWSLIVPGEEYHLKLGIADTGDGVNDTGMFIEENSIGHPRITHKVFPDPPGLEENLYEGIVGVNVVFRRPPPIYEPYTLNISLDGTADPTAWPNGDFEEDIPGSVSFEAGMDTAVIRMFPVIDGLVEGDETLLLIYEDTLGYLPILDTVKLLIQDYYELVVETSPDTTLCEGQEIVLKADVYNGYPPYTFAWEPGGSTSDSIIINPDTSTTYVVKVTDLVDSVSNSILITVVPDNTGVLEYSFKKANNPQLPWDIAGEISEDTIFLTVPEGVDISNLITTFTLEEGATGSVNNVPQISGVTPNDFSDPLVFHVVGSSTVCSKDWVISVQIASGAGEVVHSDIRIYPIPAASSIHIQNASGAHLKLVDSLGKRSISKIISQNHQSLGVSNLAPGLYFLFLDFDDERIVRKVVVRR